MSSQILAPSMMGPELSIPSGDRSSSPAEDPGSSQAYDTTFDQQLSFPRPVPTSSPLSSPIHTGASIVPITSQPDQATFEQTQRAVGNLLDALRTNNIGQSHAAQDAVHQTSSEPPERVLNDTEPQRPSVSPLGPHSPNISAARSVPVTFASAEAVNDLVEMLPLDGAAACMADFPTPRDGPNAPGPIQPDYQAQEDVIEQPLGEMAEDELPLNVQTAQDTGQISAFAKLEFDDGPFYITTYSLELGRDARAYRAAKARLAAKQAEKTGAGSSSGNSHPSNRSKREGGSQMKGSVVSDRGGFYGVDDIEGEAQEADEERQRQQADASHSSNQSASSIVNPKDLHNQPPLPHFNYQAYPIDEYEREIEEIPAPVTAEHLPQQEEGFLLPIHHAPVKDDLEQDVANHRSVSRRHAKIFWEDDCFRLHVKGVNGAFVNDIHYPMGAIVPLGSDMSIQIKGIKVHFKLPQHDLIESSEESDRIEDDSANQRAESSSATSGIERTISPNASGRTPLKVKIKNFQKTTPPPPGPPVLGPDGKPKRRGPGRPPKDGIMSKRERTAKERADREAAAKAANGGVTPEPPARGKLGKPAAKNSAETEEPKPAKRKYTKRKSAVRDTNDVAPKLEDDSEAPMDEAPPSKRSRVTRSESPEYPKLEDLKEKDLQRPPYNYSILIYDLLKDSSKPLDLKGIYRGLKMKWPHFLYRYKDAKGWESSVRHNVNEDKLKIIEKVDRVGKGYSYRAKPGVDIEQHKKKRARSPPAAHKISAPSQQRPQQQSHPPPPGGYLYPPEHQPPPANHGIYGHLVPTTLPPGSIPYSMAYSSATTRPPPAGALTHPAPYAPPGHLQQHPGAYTAVAGAQRVLGGTTGPYPTQPTSYPAPPVPAGTPSIPFNNNHQQRPAQAPNPSTYGPDHQHPPPNNFYMSREPAPQHTLAPRIPSAPTGESPYSPFLPKGLTVIATFESSLLDGVDNPADLLRIKATLASVRKQVFEGEDTSTLAGGETEDERTFLHYFRHILENEQFRNPGFVGWPEFKRQRERDRMQKAMQGQWQSPGPEQGAFGSAANETSVTKGVMMTVGLRGAGDGEEEAIPAGQDIDSHEARSGDGVEGGDPEAPGEAQATAEQPEKKVEELTVSSP